MDCVYSIRCASRSRSLGGSSTVEDSTSSVIRVFAAGDIYHRRVNDSEHLRRRCERDSRSWPGRHVVKHFNLLQSSNTDPTQHCAGGVGYLTVTIARWIRRYYPTGLIIDLGVIRLWTSGFQSVQTDGIILHQPEAMIVVIRMSW